MSGVNITDNTGEYLSAMDKAIARALEIIGGKMESYAKQRITEVGAVDTGALRNSITHRVDEKTAIVGSNIHYAPYVELGTGKEYQPPPEWIEANAEKGRGLDRWFYQDDEGNWHTGYPQKPRPYLRPAIDEHRDEYERIIIDQLKNA